MQNKEVGVRGSVGWWVGEEACVWRREEGGGCRGVVERAAGWGGEWGRGVGGVVCDSRCAQAHQQTCPRLIRDAHRHNNKHAQDCFQDLDSEVQRAEHNRGNQPGFCFASGGIVFQNSNLGLKKTFKIWLICKHNTSKYRKMATEILHENKGYGEKL